MGNLESKVSEAKAQDRLVHSYGYMIAAITQPRDEQTGEMLYGGKKLSYAPFGPVSPQKVAMDLMRKDKSNPELAQFMKDMEDVLTNDEAVKKYVELYAKYMQKSKLSSIASLATSLGINIDREAIRHYMDKPMEKLDETIKDYQKRDKDGKLNAVEKAEYLVLQANVEGLRSKISEAYKSKVEKELGKIQDKRLKHLNAQQNRASIIRFVYHSDEAKKHKTKADEAYEPIAKAA